MFSRILHCCGFEVIQIKVFWLFLCQEKRHFLHMSLKLLLFSSFFWVTHRTFKCCMPHSTTNIWKLSKHLYSILFILCRKRNANFGHDHTKYRRIFSPHFCTTNYLFLVSVSKNESFLTTTHSINHEKCI